MRKRSITQIALGNTAHTIFRIESDKSSVTSFRAYRCSSSIICNTEIASSDFVTETTVTRDCSRVRASLFLTKVYNSPFDREDSSIANLGLIFSGNSNQSSACSIWNHHQLCSAAKVFLPLHTLISLSFHKILIKTKTAARLSRGFFRGGGYLLSHFRSIIGVVRFNFSVRNGKRWNPHAIPP